MICPSTAEVPVTDSGRLLGPATKTSGHGASVRHNGKRNSFDLVFIPLLLVSPGSAGEGGWVRPNMQDNAGVAYELEGC